MVNHGDSEDTEMIKSGISRLSQDVIGCAIEVHTMLGPGLLESSYQRCLSHELQRLNIDHVTEKELPITYKGLKLDCGYRIDMLVENQIIVELKAVDKINPIHEAQVLTYMKISGIKKGLLINFNVPILKNGPSP